jgi:hypothetical protein
LVSHLHARDRAFLLTSSRRRRRASCTSTSLSTACAASSRSSATSARRRSTTGRPSPSPRVRRPSYRADWFQANLGNFELAWNRPLIDALSQLSTTFASSDHTSIHGRSQVKLSNVDCKSNGLSLSLLRSVDAGVCLSSCSLKSNTLRRAANVRRGNLSAVQM